MRELRGSRNLRSTSKVEMELDQEPSEPNEHVLSPGQPEEGDEEEDEKKNDFEHIPGHCSFCMEPASS
jgi:hypothetical protein